MDSISLFCFLLDQWWITLAEWTMGGCVKNRELWGTAVEAGNRQDYSVEEGRRKLQGEIGICRTRSGVLHRGCSDWITHSIILPCPQHDKAVTCSLRLGCVICSSSRTHSCYQGSCTRLLSFCCSLQHSDLHHHGPASLWSVSPGGEWEQVSSEPK